MGWELADPGDFDCCARAAASSLAEESSDQDVWAMLHKMMGDDPASTMSLESTEGQHYQPLGGDSMGDDNFCATMGSSSRSASHNEIPSNFIGVEPETTALMPPTSLRAGPGGFAIRSDGRESKEDLSQRVTQLEEEVIHLRQFSMALIKERGDLAVEMQTRNAEIVQLRRQNQQLDNELMMMKGSYSTVLAMPSSSRDMVQSCDFLGDHGQSTMWTTNGADRMSACL
mmetsp:Transcript_11256/g.17702  ORF Transcript_11256/g.17702 Transcript_11256/m.17702 type:complete len:228 (+) Transcript_11256:588-1271(+)